MYFPLRGGNRHFSSLITGLDIEVLLCVYCLDKVVLLGYCCVIRISCIGETVVCSRVLIKGGGVGGGGGGGSLFVLQWHAGKPTGSFPPHLWVSDSTYSHCLSSPPRPHLKSPSPCSLRYFTVLLGNIYCGGLCSPSDTHNTRSCIAFPLLQISRVYSVIFSLQRRCTGCGVPFADPRCFLPVTVHGATHAHLCWPLLWGLHQMGYSFATFGTYARAGALKWIMRVLNSQGSRLWWLHHPSRFTCVLFACISGGYHSLP